jgi:flagellar M-ring protein FliF
MDHLVRFEGDGPNRKRIVEPPSAERLKATRDIVAAVVGFNAERGDVVVVESLPFESTLSAPQALAPGGQAAPGGPSNVPSLMDWIKEGIRKRDKLVLGTLGGIGLALLLFMAGAVWVIGKRRKRKPTAIVEPENRELAGEQDPPAISAAEDNLIQQFEKQHADQMAARTREEEEQDREILQALALNKKLPSNSKRKAEVLSKYMAQQAKKTPDGLVQVVRSWMSDSEA